MTEQLALELAPPRRKLAANARGLGRTAGKPIWLRLVLGIERDDNGCWIWQRKKSWDGYGVIDALGRRSLRPHRLAYEQFIGPIPDGLTIDHLCRVKLCCNPAHLEPVTNEENTRRYLETVTHCHQGHEFTPENTYLGTRDGRPRRYCRICRRDAWNRFNKRRRATPQDLSAAGRSRPPAPAAGSHQSPGTSTTARRNRWARSSAVVFRKGMA